VGEGIGEKGLVVFGSGGDWGYEEILRERGPLKNSTLAIARHGGPIPLTVCNSNTGRGHRRKRIGILVLVGYEEILRSTNE